ncbi:Hypothetical predicted protein [Octopus vulgaris]|uniref:Uncharacterized protein n=2 Tax=Octopus vulgaris TaxID=6645 RepID=A0AA36FFD6_OCTVU|nr:Hypothetical predicted protein [Octopus vulgaris]
MEEFNLPPLHRPECSQHSRFRKSIYESMVTEIRTMFFIVLHTHHFFRCLFSYFVVFFFFINCLIYSGRSMV